MAADVYVVASPTPTLYAYPTTLHPTTATQGGAFRDPRRPLITYAAPEPVTPEDIYPLLLVGAL